MPKIKHILTKETLFDLYKNQGKTVSEIVKIFGCSDSTVQRSLKKYNIELNPANNKCIIDRDWLHQKRIIERLSYVEIGKLINVSDNVISRNCKKYKISSENYSLVTGVAKNKLEDKEWMHQKRIVENLSFVKIAEELDVSTSYVIKCFEKIGITDRKYSANQANIQEKLNDKEWMHQKRIVEKMTLRDLAKELGVDRATLTQAAAKHGMSEVSHKKISVESQAYLGDYEWLWNKYKMEFLSHRVIGKELGISEEPVRDALTKFNIEANSNGVYNTGTSNAEQEVIEFIASIYDGKILTSIRSLLGDNREIDIYLPDIKFSIEFNGVYFHLFRPNETSYSLRKDSTYHVSKTDILKDKNIELVQIWSSDWKNKKEIWKSRIKAKLGITKNKIYARKCNIKEISLETKNEFLNINHLQGQDRSTYKFGLFYEDDLVSVMTFIKADSYKSAEWELSRFATKINTQVIGGFSKLLRHFRKNNSGSIVSYADRMHSNGNVYEKNGFTLHHVNRPSYHYVKRGSDILENRQKFMKHKIANGPDDTRTEFEIMTDLGYHRIYDCGTITYVYD